MAAARFTGKRLEDKNRVLGSCTPNRPKNCPDFCGVNGLRDMVVKRKGWAGFQFYGDWSANLNCRNWQSGLPRDNKSDAYLSPTKGGLVSEKAPIFFGLLNFGGGCAKRGSGGGGFSACETGGLSGLAPG
jgi:hypothetical protein